MPEPASAIPGAVVVAQARDPEPQLLRIRELLVDAGMDVIVVSSAKEAVAKAAGPKGSPLVLVELSARERAPPDALSNPDEIAAAVGSLRASLPQAMIVAVAHDPSLAVAIAAFRAGANDFLDTATEKNEAETVATLRRIAAKLSELETRRQQIHALRDVFEDFARNLIRTERRTIDLEHELKRSHGGGDSAQASTFDSDRAATVFLIEDDRDVADMLVNALEKVGVVTYAFVSGEEAINHMNSLSRRGEAFDLALVDSKLPGIDGLEAIRRMRAVKPDLAAVLITGYSDLQTATRAADLGVVGYVLKPFDDISDLVQRIREQATIIRDQARERSYVSVIKERHQRLLSRYRELASVLDRLV